MRVAVYVVSCHAKQTYANESHDVRIWPGLSVIKHALNAAGIEVGYCGIADVHEQDVVLVSITAGCDWWPFVAERLRWKPGRYKVIAGGAGVLNVRPFLGMADAFVFGRAEGFVADLVREAAAGREMQHESVAWSSSFDPDRRYRIAQSCKYPHAVTLENGKPWREIVIGCQGKCLFCAYSWQREHNGITHQESTKGTSSLWGGSASEKTILSLDMSNPQSWQGPGDSLRIIAIDGFSERLRRSVNKPITREVFRSFLRGLATLDKPHQIKLYNLVGLPGETTADWRELTDDLAAVDAALRPEKQWSIVLHCTPFRAMPATPAAHWPMSYRNYRGQIAATLKQPQHKGNIFYQGNKFWAVEGMGTDSLASHALDAVVLRGTEADAAAVKLIAASKKFASAPVAVRVATLENYFDMPALFAELPKGQTPTDYLRSWWHPA